MTLLSRLTSLGAPTLLVLLVCGFGVESVHPPASTLIVTAAPAYDPLAALRGGERFPRGAQLLLVRGGQATPLIEGFAVTADANISFDGRRLLFAGKQNASDRWSIWEFAFEDRSVRKVMGGDSDVIRPLYLPGDRFVYSRRTALGFQLEAAKLDGSGRLPLTYVAASALPETVLADGRILFQAGFPLGTGLDHGAVPELFLVYSDGSGVESYRCDHGVPRWGGTQLTSGDVVFTHGSRLARFTSPLATEAPIAAPRADYAGAMVETNSGQWLMSARRGAGSQYELVQWKPGAPSLENVLSRRGVDLVEPVLLAPRKRPNRHPSALHPWDYANVLALDVRQSRDGALKGTPVTVRLEGLDANGNALAMGNAPVESDGSFFVKVPADKPIRFTLLDEKGAALREEHGWFWMRKGEQRYCVGCHAGPEHAPENSVPQVLLRTTTPVDLTGSGHQAIQHQAIPGGQ
jgi:hypothetical protein